MSLDTAPQDALIAAVTADPQGGLVVATTGVTVEPGTYPLTITKGQTWALYVRWFHDGKVKDTSAGTPTLTAYTEAGGTAVLNLTGTGGTAYMTFTQGTAATTALDFVRARYAVAYAEGGTVTPLFGGAVDLGKPGLG